jgi:hypothetical protein
MHDNYSTDKLSANSVVRNMSLLDKINFLKSSRMLEDKYEIEERICERARMSMLLSNADRQAIKKLPIDKKLTIIDKKFLNNDKIDEDTFAYKSDDSNVFYKIFFL